MDASKFNTTRRLIYSLKLNRLKNKYNNINNSNNENKHHSLYKIASKIKKLSDKKAKLIDYKKSKFEEKRDANLLKKGLASRLKSLHYKAVVSSHEDESKKLKKQASEFEKRADIHLEKSIN